MWRHSLITEIMELNSYLWVCGTSALDEHVRKQPSQQSSWKLPPAAMHVSAFFVLIRTHGSDFKAPVKQSLPCWASEQAAYASHCLQFFWSTVAKVLFTLQASRCFYIWAFPFENCRRKCWFVFVCFLTKICKTEHPTNTSASPGAHTPIALRILSGLQNYEVALSLFFCI